MSARPYSLFEDLSPNDEANRFEWIRLSTVFAMQFDDGLSLIPKGAA